MEYFFIITIILYMTWSTTGRLRDKPCLSKATNNSIVCVCTSNYCDTITRETPKNGKYYTYVSTESGQRFKKTTAYFKPINYDNEYDATLELDPNTKYQTINGFGGAVTDAAGINWKNLSDPKLMQHLIESYCGSKGIEYNMLRVPIAGTDFSTHPYTYNVTVENGTLTEFSLALEDYEYKIPMIKACMDASPNTIDIVSASWTAPKSWKTNEDYSGYSLLMKKYFQPYADYHLRFIEEYTKEGIPIWGFTTSNEPLDATLNWTTINDMGWTLPFMAEWIINNLGPTIRNTDYKDVKIMAVDDQRFTIPLYWNIMVSAYPQTLEYLDGVAVHFYFDKIVPAELLTQTMKDYPDKFVLSTEACSGAAATDFPKVDLGNWQRAVDYVVDIIEDLSNNVIGWIDWNMCLNSEGGPNWVDNFVDSPIIVNPEAGEFYKQPMFYAIGHFSKFVPRGSRRIKTTTDGITNVQYIAFLTPNNTIVIVLYNGGEEESLVIRVGDQETQIHVNEKSFTTIEMPYDNDDDQN